MSTIKDVAKLAQVSIGSVSNVLNGKTKNEDLIERVSHAMDVLNYSPDMNAQSLRNAKSGLIGLVLPDAANIENYHFLTYLEEILRKLGYDLLVKFSRHNRVLTEKAIENFKKRNVDGMILHSSYQTKKRDLGLATVCYGNVQVKNTDLCQVVVDYQEAFEKMLLKLKEAGKKKVALILNPDLEKNQKLIELYTEQFDSLLVIVPSDSEDYAFQAFYQMAETYPDIDAVIAGNHIIACGVEKVKRILLLHSLDLVVFKESSWIVDEGHYFGQITYSQEKLAKTIADCLENMIQRNGKAVEQVIKIEAKCDVFYSEWDFGTKSELEEKICFVLLDCPTARALKNLTRVYEREKGITVQLDLLPYREIEKRLFQQAEEKNAYYDGFMVDLPWIDPLIETGYVKNLDYLYQKDPDFFSGFLLNTLKSYGKYYESYYGVPFVSGAQLLFYQKDLFENQTLKNLFRRKYREELEPPKNWEQFNEIAEFFTKKYNERSPVKYGVSQVCGSNVYTSIQFLNHLWAYGGRVFDESGEIVINSENARSALENYIQSFRYTSGNETVNWNSVNEEFRSGTVAMMVLYDSDMGQVKNYVYSKVAGNVGYSQIPGQSPVLGGWCLALNTYGKHQQEAEAFLKWALSRESCTPIAMLGGSTLREEYYNHSETESWKKAVCESFSSSHKRCFPECLDGNIRRNDIYTTIIPEEIEAVRQEKITVVQALKNMEYRIGEFIKDCESGTD